MLTEIFRSIATATRAVLGSWRSMAVIAIVYVVLLAALYSFIAVREASVAQVVATFALAIAAPLLFFMLQAMIVGVAGEEGGGFDRLLKRSLVNLWKLLLVTLPLIALGILLAYLLAKAQVRLGTSLHEASEIPRRLSSASSAKPARPVDWRAAIVSTARYLTFGLILPLAAIHLWLAAGRQGLGHAVRKLGSLVVKAFAPRSVLVYAIGFLIFAVAPYLLLFRSLPSKHAWLELFLLVTRLTVIFALTLFGWAITVKALALLNDGPPSREPVNETA